MSHAIHPNKRAVHTQNLCIRLLQTNRHDKTPAFGTLGTFGRLPAEIRHMVWRNFRPESGDPRRSLSVLQTCHNIQAEAKPLIYKDQVLTFHLSPTYDSRSWIKVTNEAGALWTQPTLKDTISKNFWRVPSKDLKRIEILIEAPAKEDPGQLICLARKTRNLVELLLGGTSPSPWAKGLNIVICFVETEKSQWMDMNETQWSLRRRQFDWLPHGHCGDLEFIASYFRELQSLSKGIMQLQTHEAGLEHDHKMIDINKMFQAILDGVSGVDQTLTRDYWSLEETRIRLNRFYYATDYMVQDMPGITARMMRLETFSAYFAAPEEMLTMSGEYISDMQMRFQRTPGLVLRDKLRIKRGLSFMLLFCPESQKMRTVRDHLHSLGMRDIAPSFLEMIRSWDTQQWLDFVDIVVCPKPFSTASDVTNLAATACFDWEKAWLQSLVPSREPDWKFEWLSHLDDDNHLLSESRIAARRVISMDPLPTLYVHESTRPDLLMLNAHLKTRWCSREEWHRFYPDGIPRMEKLHPGERTWLWHFIAWLHDPEMLDDWCGGADFEDWFSTHTEEKRLRERMYYDGDPETEFGCSLPHVKKYYREVRGWEYRDNIID